MAVVQERLEREYAVEGGWLLDGFPGPPTLRSEGPLKPDAVVVLDRPDDLAVAFVSGGARTRRRARSTIPICSSPDDARTDPVAHDDTKKW